MQRIFAGLIAFLLTTDAMAQNPVQLSEAEYKVASSGGVPQFCSIEFTIMYRDFTYTKGSFAGVTGSLSWSALKGQIALMLKVVGTDLPRLHLNDPTPIQYRVANAFAALNGQSYAPDTTFECDAPKAFCGVYQMPKSTDLLEALGKNGSLTVGFNRHAGGLDVVLPVDTGVKDPEAARRFNACLGLIFERAREQLRSGSKK